MAAIRTVGGPLSLTNSIRDQVVQELADIGGMISQLNQSYSFSAITGHHSSTAGSFGVDLIDSCDVSCGDAGGTGALCVSVFVGATHEG